MDNASLHRSPENQLSQIIIGCAIEVHRTLGGPGLLEDTYEEAFVWEMQQQGLSVRRQVRVPIHYKGVILSTPLKLDVEVEGLVIVECKALEQVPKVCRAQLLTYLRLTERRLGLLINFGAEMVRNGVVRVVNGLHE